MRKILFITLSVLLFSCSSAPSSKNDIKYVKVIKAAEKFAEENCQSFRFDPDEAYMTISKYDNYQMFKNHHLFEVEQKELRSKDADNIMSYLSADTYFEYKFGWLKNNYSQKSFWAISSMPQRKNPEISLGKGYYGFIFVDDEKIDGIKNPRMSCNCVCDPEKYKKLRSKPKVRVEREDRDVLFDAVIDSDIGKADEFLKKELIIKESDQEQFFSWAIYNCNRDMILKLSDKYKINSFQIKEAIYCRDSVLIEKMLMKISKFKDENYFDLVNEALMLVEHDIVKVLVKHWSNEKFGSDSLQYYLSILANDRKAVEKYVSDPKFGANYNFEIQKKNYVDDEITETPFWLALKNRNAELAVYFIEKGANLELTNAEKFDQFTTYVFYHDFFTEQEVKNLIAAIQKTGISTDNWNLDFYWDYFHTQFWGFLPTVRDGGEFKCPEK